MNPLERQARIVERLRVKPINHGQLETDQLVVPQTLNISQEQKSLLLESLERQGTNLIPIIVRKTDGDDDYEVVFGAECCLAAQELKLPRVWVWMFDLNNEQAAAIREEMTLLMGATPNISQPVIEEPSSSSETHQLLKTISRQLEQQPKHSITLAEVEHLIDERFEAINNKLNKFAGLEQIEKKFDELAQLIAGQKDKPSSSKDVQKPATSGKIPALGLLDLSQITQTDLLEQKFSIPQSKAAFTAITQCKRRGDLTWGALGNCAKSGKDKVTGFSKATLQKLQTLGRIPGDPN